MTTKAEDMTQPGTLLMVPDIPPEVLAEMQKNSPGWSREDCQFCALLMHHADAAYRESIAIGMKTLPEDDFAQAISPVIARFVENREELAATMALLAIKPERKRRLASVRSSCADSPANVERNEP